MKKTIFAALAAIFLPAFAFAGITLTGSSVQVKSFSYVPNDSSNLTFNQFNAASISGSNVTLTGITITLSITKSGGEVFADNDSASNSGAVTLSQSVNTVLTSSVFIPVALTSGSGLTLTTATTANVTTTTGDEVGVFNATHNSDYADSGVFATISTGSTKAVSSTYWNGGYSGDLDKTFTSYVGTGTYILTATSSQNSSVTGVGGVNYSVNVASESGTVTVEYLYAYDVPEPSTWAMIVGGVGMLAMGQRLRRHLR